MNKLNYVNKLSLPQQKKRKVSTVEPRSRTLDEKLKKVNLSENNA